MGDCAPACSQQASELNNLNGKLGYDSAAQLQNQSFLDNQADARAWAAHKLRIAGNTESFDHAIRMGSVIAGQSGYTENQQTVSPVRTATGDAIVGGVGVAGEQIAANIAALGDVVTKFADAMAAVLLTAAGGASTPSQTQAKPVAA
jgi:hypothetical protein